MTLPAHTATYQPYRSPWPVIHFFNALVHDPELALDFEQADANGKDAILEHFGLGRKHVALFTPSGPNRPLSNADVKAILDEARKEILAKLPANFW